MKIVLRLVPVIVWLLFFFFVPPYQPVLVWIFIAVSGLVVYCLMSFFLPLRFSIYGGLCAGFLLFLAREKVISFELLSYVFTLVFLIEVLYRVFRYVTILRL